jgi:HEAT repeat protein
MISLAFLRVAIIVEGSAIILVIAFYLLRGFRNNRYRETTGPMLAALRRDVMRVLITPAGIRDLIWKLKKIPVKMQARVFLSLSPSLAGAQRQELVGIAGEIGLVEHAAHSCHSRRWYRRLEGARLLTALGSDAAVMVGLLSDTHPMVRSQAAEWAQEHKDPELIAQLLLMLRDPVAICRYTARESLLGIGADTVDAFITFMDDLSDDDVPREALEVVIGLASPRLLDSTIRFTSHENPLIRSLAARAFGAMGTDAGVAVLIGLLDDPDPGTRSEAARALGLLGHWPAGPRLASLLSDRTFEVRREAARALKSMGAPGEVLLRKITRGDDRYASAMAKHVLETPGAVPAGRLLA